LLKRWNTDATSVIKQAISKAMYGTSIIIVLVGEETHLSKWVHEEVEMTIGNNKTVYAIRIKNTNGIKPKVLEEKDIFLYSWSEEKLQELATF
jgi:hypothetical protein